MKKKLFALFLIVLFSMNLAVAQTIKVSNDQNVLAEQIWYGLLNFLSDTWLPILIIFFLILIVMLMIALFRLLGGIGQGLH